MTDKQILEKAEELRAKVEAIEETFSLWREAGIPENTIVILLAHYTKLPQRDVKSVLQGMDVLYETYFQE